MVQRTKPPVHKIALNGQSFVRNYTMEIRNMIKEGSERIHSCTALIFTLQYLGMNPDKNLEYRFRVSRRVFLNERNQPIFKPSKAQKIALMVAKINDDLIIEVEKGYKIVGLSNTEKVRAAWETIRADLLQLYPDMETLCADFDWQLQEKNIQSLFKTDNFFTFFFANIFYQEFENDTFPKIRKQIRNGFGDLDIPIVEKRHLSKQDMLFQNITIRTEAELDTENEKFPLEKMNIVLGRLLNESNKKHDLNFSYNGEYQLKPRIGLITGGRLEYEFNIEDIYNKKTTITFNLENDER